ncbi:MAG: hypothetical protein ACYDC1_08480 [Limisphaerales bacterium]
MKTPWLLSILGLVLSVAADQAPALQPPSESRVWRYRLLPGSTFEDECRVCDRLPIIEPIQGEFDLVWVDEGPAIARFEVTNLRAVDFSEETLRRVVLGGGQFERLAEPAGAGAMRLAVNVAGNGTQRDANLTNVTLLPAAAWPLLEVDLGEVGGTDFTNFKLRLRAAPLQELWFATPHGMTPGIDPSPGRIEGGDLLADAGRVIRPRQRLLASLGFEPGSTNLPIDALTVADGGEVWFSFPEDVDTPKLGLIHDGDVVSDAGRMVRRSAQLLGAFALMPPIEDPGVDGLQLLDDGQILFSIRRPVFSERLGQRIERSDLLSDAGVRVRSGQELRSAFKPVSPDAEPGLDAFHLWPGGEVWFSTEEGFESATEGVITDGDLLSSRGYVVYRNLDLVRWFQPLEDLANFGLTSLFVISDATAPPKASTLLPPGFSGTPAAPGLRWELAGRCAQVERAFRVEGPYRATSPLILDTEWADPLATGREEMMFYRLRQW